MSQTNRPLKDNNTSNENLDFGLRRSFRNKMLQTTPRRPKLDTSSTASSSGSGSSTSSRASSVFDRTLKSPGTPLTPPILNESYSSGEKGRNVTKNGISEPLKLRENALKLGIAFATPSSVTPAPILTTSQMKAKPLENRSFEEDDELLTKLMDLTIDDPPSPSAIALSKRRNRPAIEPRDNYFYSTSKATQLDHKSKDRDVSRLSEGASGMLVPKTVSPKNVRSSNVSKATSSSSKEKYSETLPVITFQSGDEVGDVAGPIGGRRQSSPTSEKRHNEEAALSAPQTTHRRSVSMPTTSDDGSESQSISATTIVHGSTHPGQEATTPSKSHKLRRRSTGSLDAVRRTSTSTVEHLTLGDEEPEHEITPPEPSKRSTTSKRRSSHVRGQKGQNTEQKFPDLEDYNTSKLDQGSLKPKILEAIQGKRMSKLARLRAIRHRLDNMWKAWSGTSERVPRDPASEDGGYIYIFKSKADAFPGPRYVKIGKTKQIPERRRRQWELQCNFEAIHVKDDKDKRFVHYHAVEKIIHAELYNKRRKYLCNECKKFHYFKLGKNSSKSTQTEHGEWFEISEDEALQVVNKWRDWVIDNEPYRPDGTLRTRWVWKCAAGSFWMNGTEEDWAAWRKFHWFETLRCVLHHLKQWASRVLPLVIEILMMPETIFGLALMWYFSAWGFNIGSFVICLSGVFALVYLLLDF